ncbi:hypothetical protein QYF36_010517 [Acer negundo]|nr:hypothetical protein QYF36_010517 [Acer negundo]
MLCDDGHVPEVKFSVVEKVNVEHGHMGICTDQPVYQSFLHQFAAQFQSSGGSNNVLGYIPTTDHAIETPSVNPLIDDFDEDYIGHGGSREGVNYETTHYDGMESDPSEVSGRSLKPKEIVVDIQVEHGLGLLYSKLVNPGTVTAIKTNVAQQFEYLFIALSASLVGFQTAKRPAICIDATHLKGNFGGVMFIAACQDANNQVFPLAYGWGDVECEDS